MGAICKLLMTISVYIPSVSLMAVAAYCAHLGMVKSFWAVMIIAVLTMPKVSLQIGGRSNTTESRDGEKSSEPSPSQRK